MFYVHNWVCLVFSVNKKRGEGVPFDHTRKYHLKASSDFFSFFNTVISYLKTLFCLDVKCSYASRNWCTRHNTHSLTPMQPLGFWHLWLANGPDNEALTEKAAGICYATLDSIQTITVSYFCRCPETTTAFRNTWVMGVWNCNRFTEKTRALARSLIECVLSNVVI